MNFINLIQSRTQKNLKCLFIIASALFVFNLSVTAQNRQVQFKGNVITLKAAFKQIEEQAQVSIDYDSKVINSAQKINVSNVKGELQDALNSLFKNTNYTYSKVGKHIIVKLRNPQGTAKKVKGVVKDNNGEPIIGANIIVKGTENGTITDIDGNFSLNVQEGSILHVSYIGYNAQDAIVGKKSDIEIVLNENTKAIDEVVVVGFATQKKVNLTGAVGVADTKMLQERPVITAAQALQGVTPGLVVDQCSGGVGDRPTLNVRGTATIGAGSTGSPLVLIDGMEGYINSINPQDIESISVLKDAAASSIYGSRAPFGVILVTTKSGQSGKVTVNYNNNFRWASATRLPEMMDSYSFALYMNEAYMNSGQSPYYNDDALQRMLDYQQGKLTTNMQAAPGATKWEGRSPILYGNDNNDWYDVTFRNKVLSQEHNMSINGGNKDMNYYFSANYLDQNGLLRFGDDNYKRYTVTAKVNANIGKYIKLSYSNRYIHENVLTPTSLSNDLIFRTACTAPCVPVYDPNGYLWDGASRVIRLEEGGNTTKATDWLYQQLKLTGEFIKDWKLNAEINYRLKQYDQHQDALVIYKHDINGDPYVFEPNSSVSESYQNHHYWNVNLYTDYSLNIKDTHHFKVLGGFQLETFKQKTFSAKRAGIMLSELPELDLTTGIDSKGEEVVPTVSGSRSEWATCGFFGRINYDYKQRYLIEANLRYDGTSRFRADSRWGLFPSVSAGWNISEEPFMNSLRDVIDHLKLRASYGELGNQNTSSYYPTYELMAISTAGGEWLLNGSKPNISGQPSLIYQDLTWETVKTLNAGLDFALLNNRLTSSFDTYVRRTCNMVGPAPQLPATLGIGVPKMNNTDLKTYGWELSLSWNDNIGKDFRYGARLSLSDSQTKITNYPNETGSLAAYRNGQTLGEIWGYKVKGIAKTQEEMDAHLAKVNQTGMGSKWSAGDLMYEDIDNSGKIDAGMNLISDHGDKVVIGNNTPRYRFGIDLNASYKGFDIRVFFQGVMKRDYFAEYVNPLFWGMTNNRWLSAGLVGQEDYFRPADTTNPLGPNLDSYFPRPIQGNDTKNCAVTDRYLQNASYIRLKNLQVGYNIPNSILRKAGIAKLRLFVSGENLWLGTKLFKTLDPEMIDGGQSVNNITVGGSVYPLTKVISTGLNITF